ncbi:hypothetical protein SynSYN20_01667 [Synechococcus sp. SYN20]|uniref:hypothetical protein n=1 Tax=Synechococcus sp. SYN20 TaxID=1050714 RepID=UPI0016489259|nr:hypothetical protein [Synechococcus sp. SYN20]QNJ25994.1 hypothetical protein SynSYN20_01667 [Synechococcus sp. SYN20]
MQTPDWTHFRSADTDPAGPACLLATSFSLSELPKNYIWTIGYIGQWLGPEEAEINAQVKSYSREYLIQRAEELESKKNEAVQKQQQLEALRQQRNSELDRLTKANLGFKDEDAIKQRVEAGPLKMARSLVKSAADLATGGVTDPTARMEICNTCPFKGDDQRCGKCGCFLPAKTRVKKSSCPIGRW